MRLRILIPVLILALVAVYYMWEVEESSIVAELETLRQEFTQVSQAAQKVQARERQVEQAKAEFAPYQKLMLKDNPFVTILSVIDKSESRSGLKVVTIQPGAVTPQGPHKRYPVTVNMNGTYPQLLTFLKTLEEQTLVTRVSEVEMRLPGPNLPPSIQMQIVFFGQ